MDRAKRLGLSRYVYYTREQWSRLRGGADLPLSAGELAALRGLNETISLTEVAEIYLPLSRVLNVFVANAQRLHTDVGAIMGTPVAKVPYIIGLAGSVAVGKSTTARILQALLARWPHHPKVDLITTDGFLYPNQALAEHGLMERKGFPESYDLRRLVQFLADVKAGAPDVAAPVYSHLVYDIVPHSTQRVGQPDILIVEGLNVLQTWDSQPARPSRVFVSDFFDFSIYVDAAAADIEQWFLERFLMLRATAFRDPTSFFRRFAELSDEAAVERARRIWREINAPNLAENIEPTRERAHLILGKSRDHSVQGVRLRKL